jgi:hypothetical protein
VGTRASLEGIKKRKLSTYQDTNSNRGAGYLQMANALTSETKYVKKSNDDCHRDNLEKHVINRAKFLGPLQKQGMRKHVHKLALLSLCSFN